MIQVCTICVQRKLPIRTQRAALQSYVVGVPMERMAIDVLGPFPETYRENKVILVEGNYFTKWIEAFALPNQEAKTVAEKLVEEVVCRYGVPRALHSDQGRNFESNLMKDMCALLGIGKTRTTPFNPKSDGFVKRFNRTLVEAMSKLLAPEHHQRDWDIQIPYVLMAHRSARQSSTGESPNMLMFEREVTYL